ncbi:MAG: molybdate ABC transporter substrate-binding protein [Acidobacteria bacterium]|nr:molybdate ABC transporter substrate-binding protein [Acidobacteriota bacterium]
MLGHLLALALAALLPVVDSQPVVVSAAISLTDALGEIEQAYTAAGGGALRFNFAGSNVLARQIVNGAPVDIFISADQAQMDYAEQRGAIENATRIDLLANRLAVVTPAGKGSTAADLQALLRLKRIAVADPAAVPAGVYARQFLERAGAWQVVQGRLLPLANVRAALAAAESGGADAAIVYESDAAASKKVDLGFVVTGAAAPRILYPAAIVARSKTREPARKFMVFLRAPQAAAIFQRYKFTNPADAR